MPQSRGACLQVQEADQDDVADEGHVVQRQDPEGTADIERLYAGVPGPFFLAKQQGRDQVSRDYEEDRYSDGTVQRAEQRICGVRGHHQKDRDRPQSVKWGEVTPTQVVLM